MTSLFAQCMDSKQFYNFASNKEGLVETNAYLEDKNTSAIHKVNFQRKINPITETQMIVNISWKNYNEKEHKNE